MQLLWNLRKFLLERKQSHQGGGNVWQIQTVRKISKENLKYPLESYPHPYFAWTPKSDVLPHLVAFFFCQHIFTAIKFVSWKVQRRHVYCIISLTCSLVSFLHYNSPLVLRSSFLVHFKCVGNIEETLSAQYLASYWIIFEVSTSSGEHLGWIIFHFEVWMG